MAPTTADLRQQLDQLEESIRADDRRRRQELEAEMRRLAQDCRHRFETAEQHRRREVWRSNTERYALANIAAVAAQLRILDEAGVR